MIVLNYLSSTHFENSIDWLITEKKDSCRCYHKIMKSISLLLEQSAMRRTYTSDWFHYLRLEKTVKDFQFQRPGKDWSKCCKLLDGAPGRSCIIQVSHFVSLGGLGTDPFEASWGLKMPKWVDDFFSKIDVMALALRNVVVTVPPIEAVKIENEYRHQQGDSDLSIRLIRFAHDLSSSGHFALRQRLRDDSWHVVFVDGMYSAAEVQSEEWEDADGDENLDLWLLRLLETDGHPLFKNNNYETEPYQRLISITPN